jgi:hypothetical protein
MINEEEEEEPEITDNGDGTCTIHIPLMPPVPTQRMMIPQQEMAMLNFLNSL